MLPGGLSPGPVRCCSRHKCPGKKGSPMTDIARRSQGRTDKCGRPHPYTSGSARVASIPRRTSFPRLENHASNNKGIGDAGGRGGRSKLKAVLQSCKRWHLCPNGSLFFNVQGRSVTDHQGLAGGINVMINGAVGLRLP